MARSASLPGGQRAERVHHRHLVVELRVPERHRRLVGEDGGHLALGRGGEIRRAGLEHQDAEDAFLVLEREVESALDGVGLEVRAEDR